MDFNLVLRACYSKSITPFMLLSRMKDYSNNDVSLTDKCRTLFEMHKREDIFSRISLCKREELDSLLTNYKAQERECVIAISRLMHPDWIIGQVAEPRSEKGQVVVKRQAPKNPQAQPPITAPKAPARKSPAKKPPAPNPPVQTPAPIVNNAVAPALKKRPRGLKSISIYSLISRLEIEVDDKATDFEVYSYKNGRKTTLQVVRKSNRLITISIEPVVADKVVVKIPKAEYDSLVIRKVSDDIVLVDKFDSFRKLEINSSVGNLDLTTSAEAISIYLPVGEVKMKYRCVLRKSKPSVRMYNRMGDIMIKLFDVGVLYKSITTMKGKVHETFKPTPLSPSGLRLNIFLYYGDIFIA